MSERRIMGRRRASRFIGATILSAGTIFIDRKPGVGNVSSQLLPADVEPRNYKVPMAMVSTAGPYGGLYDGQSTAITPFVAAGDQLPPPVIRKSKISVAEENAKEGHDGWKLTRPDSSVGAFTVPSSVAPGENIDFHVAAGTTRHKLSIYRLGWYGGRGGRLVDEQDSLLSARNSTAVDSQTRATIASWGPTRSMTVPYDWRSGVYVAVATATNGGQALAPFWVRSQEKTAPIIASSGLLTSAVYNNWTLSGYGGASATGLDRPNRARGGVGEVLPWDISFLRWMERSGIDADYMADVDSHNIEDIYQGRKLIVLMGHHEYYTQQMRQRFDEAVGKGTNAAVFGSNALYWRVRLEDSVHGKNRIVVAYRSGGRDPNTANPTGQFRNLGNPEAKVLGVAYEQTSAGNDWVVSNPDHWVFEGTGLKKGDSVKRVIGPEYDTIFDNVPTGGREIIAESVVNPGPKQGHSYSCVVSHESGAKVFTAGSLDWVFALDDYRLGWARNYPINVDERAQRIAANVLIKLSQ